MDTAVFGKLNFGKPNQNSEFIQNGEMPPEDAKQIPSLDERDEVFSVLDGVLVEEAKKNAGDPGIVLPRRLSNSEYDLSVSHLIGVDISPTFSFPPDPAGGEGFDNTGESLTMSPKRMSFSARRRLPRWTRKSSPWKMPSPLRLPIAGPTKTKKNCSIFARCN